MDISARVNGQGIVNGFLFPNADFLKLQGVASMMIRTSPIESECLEFQFDDELDEIRVVRHGMGLSEGGECVYSLIRDKE
jgi:hypothetical protein